MTLLPPNATPLERALESAIDGLADLPVPLRDLWNPATCPAALLPFLAWGVSIDFWDRSWSEPAKRAAIAASVEQQRRKGTRASLRAILDRFDPLISLVEWFEDPDTMAPHTFRLDLPLAADSEVTFDSALVDALLRDIAAAKPLRSHMTAVYHLKGQLAAYLLGGSQVVGFSRLDGAADLAVPLDPIWANYLQTEIGEPIAGGEGEFLETA